MVAEMSEVVKTGLWVGDCFIYTNSVNRINYFVGGEVVTVSHLDRPMYLLGYVPRDNRLYLCDKELSVVSYSLLLSVLEYQTAVMRKDFETANRVLPTVPKEHRTRVAHFLEKQVRDLITIILFDHRNIYIFSNFIFVTGFQRTSLSGIDRSRT